MLSKVAENDVIGRGTRFPVGRNRVPSVKLAKIGIFTLRNRFLSVKIPILANLTLGTRFLPTGNRVPRPITSFSATFDSILHPLSFPNFQVRIGTLGTLFHDHFTPL